MYGNYYGVAQPPMPKWYNPNKFSAADAAFAYAMSAFGLLFLQFFVPVAFDFLQDQDFAVDILFTVISQSFMVGLALLMGKRKHVDVIRGGGMYLDSKQEYFLLVILCFFIAITVFAPLTDVIEGIFFTPEQLTSMGLDGEGPLLYALYVLIVVCPAIGEELLFRGVIANGLREYGKGKAVIISALAFTLMHTNPLQTVYQLFLGILLGLIYVETKSILPCMLLHGLNNALSGLSALVYDITDPTLKIVYYALTVALGLAALAWLMYATVKKGKSTNQMVIAVYPLRSEYAEELHRESGRYYAAIKTALPVGFADETVEFRQEQTLPSQGQGKWFFSERLGWRPFNKKSKKWKVIFWFALAFIVNFAVWTLVLAALKGWIAL